MPKPPCQNSSPARAPTIPPADCVGCTCATAATTQSPSCPTLWTDATLRPARCRNTIVRQN
eukprot:2880558-Prymnesium_polylepis.1